MKRTAPLKRTGFRKHTLADLKRPVNGSGMGRKRPGKPLKATGKGIRTKRDPNLREWSRKVRERDDFTCQMTGIRDVKRNIAHHVCPRSRRPDLRLDVSNGITLTPESHQWVHDHPIEATRAGWLSDSSYELAQKERAA